MTVLKRLTRQLYTRWRNALATSQFERTLAAGKSHLERGELDAARQRLRTALAARAHDAQALELAHAIAENEGNYGAVLQLLHAACTDQPRHTTALRLLGQALRKQGDLAGAADCYQRVLEIDAQDHRSWNALGIVAMERSMKQEARNAFERALKLAPHLAEAHCNLGILALDDQCFDDAIQRLEQALALDPGLTEARCNLGMAFYGAGFNAQAEQVLAQALAQDPGNRLARLYTSFGYLMRGEWRTGWELFEERLRAGNPARSFNYPDWDGGSLGGKVILVYGEQGLGDQIMFANCLPDVIARAAQCVVVIDDRLQRLLQRSFPAARVLGWSQARSGALAACAIDWQVAIGSLPRHFRNTPQEFSHAAYLAADAGRVAYWRARLARLGGGLKVGISWRGGTLSTRRALRSLELEQWRPLLQQRGAHFVSLQYTDCSAELDALRRQHGIAVQEWPEAIANYDETAALVGALDLVISVCTSVVHLAGALGKPAWVLVPASPEWRYMSAGKSMPWYASVELLRQRQNGMWQPLLAELSARLATWAGERRDLGVR